MFSRIKNIVFFKTKHIDPKKELGSIVVSSYLVFFIPLMLLYLLVLISLFGQIAFDVGKNQALSVIINFKECNDENYYKWRKCVSYVGKDKIKYKGYLVFNNNEHIALYKNDITVVNKKTSNR